MSENGPRDFHGKPESAALVRRLWRAGILGLSFAVLYGAVVLGVALPMAEAGQGLKAGGVMGVGLLVLLAAEWWLIMRPRLTEVARVLAERDRLADELRHELAENRALEGHFDRALAALDAADSAIVIADATLPDMPLAYVNRSFERITGYKVEEAIGRNCRFLQGPDTDPADKAALKAAVRAGRSHFVTLRNYRKDGTPFWNALEISPVRNKAGELTHFVGVQRDVTEILETQEQLRQSEARFRDLAETVPGVLFQWREGADGTHGFTWLSQATMPVWGISPEELQADFTKLPVHPDDVPAWVASIAEAVRTMSTWRFQGRLIMQDGKIHWWRGLSRPHKAPNGDVIFNGIVFDITEERLVAQNLEENLALHQALIGNAPIAITVMGVPDGDPILMNEAARHMLRLPDGTPPPAPLINFLAKPDDRAAIFDLLEQGRPVIDRQTLLKRQTGEEFWALVSVARITFHGRRANLIMFADINDRIAAELKMADSERRFRTLAETIPGMVFQLTPDPALGARFLWVSPRAREVVGIDAAELMAGTRTLSFANGDRARFGEQLNQAVRDMAGFEFEGRLEQDGTQRSIQAFATPEWDENGEVVYTGILFDVTPARAATEALERERARMGAILDSGIDGILSADEHQTITSFSRGAEIIFGWSAPEMLGRSLHLLIPEEYRAKHDEGIAAFVRAGQEGHAKANWRMVKGLRKDGSIFPAMVSFARAEAGGEVILSAVLRDMSDVMAQEAAVRDSQLAADRARAEEARADAANRAKTAFLANISHELRTPLNAIGNYTTLIKEELADKGPPEVLSDLAQIDIANRHLLSIINHVLDLSKIESGKMDLNIETFALEPFIEEVASLVRPLGAANNNRFDVKVTGTLGNLTADPVRMRQSLVNLLGNAFKFTKDGRVSLKVTGGADHVTFEVHDTGIGMSAEELEKLFKPFTQADAMTTRKFGGTGLGLALTREFLNLMGGTVTAKSQKGEGSVFTVRVPRDQEQLVLHAPRLTTIDQEEAISHLQTDGARRLFRIWAGWRVDQEKIPTRENARRRDLGELNSYVAYLEHDGPGLWVLRQPGAVMEEIAAQPLDGRNYLDLTPPEGRAARDQRLSQGLSWPCGLHSLFRLPDGQPFAEILTLPLAGEEEQALTGVFPISRATGEEAPKMHAGATPNDIEFIDLGAGVPDL